MVAGGVDRINDDIDAAALVVVVGAAVKCPVGGAAGNIGEGCTQVETGQDGTSQAGAGAVAPWGWPS